MFFITFVELISSSQYFYVLGWALWRRGDLMANAIKPRRQDVGGGKGRWLMENKHEWLTGVTDCGRNGFANRETGGGFHRKTKRQHGPGSSADYASRSILAPSGFAIFLARLGLEERGHCVGVILTATAHEGIWVRRRGAKKCRCSGFTPWFRNGVQVRYALDEREY
jgi:hypothetical protein